MGRRGHRIVLHPARPPRGLRVDRRAVLPPESHQQALGQRVGSRSGACALRFLPMRARIGGSLRGRERRDRRVDQLAIAGA